MPDYATGPARHTRSPGAVVDAYLETEALDHHCPQPKGGCGASPGEFCHHPDGTERKMPCPVRIPARPDPAEPGDEQ